MKKFTGREIHEAFALHVNEAVGSPDPDLEAFNESLDLGLRPVFELIHPDLRDQAATLFLLGLKCGRDIARARALN